MTSNAKPKTAEEFRDNLILIVGQSKIFGMLPIPEMLDMIERADAFGGMVDPTLYRDKRAAMMEDKRILEAALPLYHLGRELEARAMAALQSKLAAAGGGA